MRVEQFTIYISKDIIIIIIVRFKYNNYIFNS